MGSCMSPRPDEGPEGQASSAFDPVLRPLEQVERQLRKAIVTGVFTRGERLPSEAALAEQMHVSRATIREALRILADAGLLTKTAGANGGSFVEYFDHHTLGLLLSDRLASTIELGSISYEEVAEFRNLLEVPSARLAAVNRGTTHLQQLNELVTLEKTTTVDDPEVPSYNANFHSILADASGNRVLAAFVRALHRITHPLKFIDTSPELGRQAVIHHIAIVKAVRARDADAAGEAMSKHLEYLHTHAITDSGHGRPRSAGRART
jgi:GntR family transcriptional regulator, transcriptional repressor for pyruvate dehydrogenase complex